MAVTRVQEKSALGNSNSAAVTFSTGSTSGNFLIAMVAVLSGTASAPTSFSTAVSNATSGAPFIYLFYEANAGSITTITSSLSASNRWTMYIAEYSGVKTSSPLDQKNSANTASGSAPVTGNITTLYTNELIIAGLSTAGSNTFASPTGGFSLVDSNQTSVALTATAYLDLIAASTAGGYSTSANTTTGGNGVISSFLSTSSVIGTYVQNAIWSGSVF
jgi:hypothetical protein